LKKSRILTLPDNNSIQADLDFRRIKLGDIIGKYVIGCKIWNDGIGNVECGRGEKG
jgi:hypothetical protein